MVASIMVQILMNVTLWTMWDVNNTAITQLEATFVTVTQDMYLMLMASIVVVSVYYREVKKSNVHLSDCHNYF